MGTARLLSIGKVPFCVHAASPWIAWVTLPMFSRMTVAVLLVYFMLGLVTWLPDSMRAQR
jgi:hypothetical protein